MSAQAYSASALPPAQSKVLDDLEAYGLIYRRPTHPTGKRHDQFYPTGLATTLCAGSSAGVESGEGGKGFLILETNYKVYAYTCELAWWCVVGVGVDRV